MSIQYPRTRRYIGQEPTVVALRAAYREAAHAATGRGFVIQADGGLGKTFLLYQLPQILALEASDVCIARIVDLSDPDTRRSTTVQRAIIEGLSVTATRVFRFPPALVAEKFAAYDTLETELESRRAGLSPSEIEAYNQRLRQLFVAGLTELAESKPLILCFDTLESLMSVQVNDFLQHAFPTSAELFYSWVCEVLPQLPRTLAIFCGRPPEAEQPIAEVPGATLRTAGRAIATVLDEAGLLAAPPQQLLPFMPNELDEYLAEYGELPEGPIEPADIQKKTGGLPLLITALLEDRKFPDELKKDEEVDSRAAFEQALLTYVLNPLVRDPQRGNAKQVLNYALFVLSYARRGITHHDLLGFLDEHGYLSNPISGERLLTAQEIERLIETLREMALTKRRPGSEVLYLHDHIYRVIDESELPDGLGMREQVLIFLLKLVQQQRAAAAGARRKLFIAKSDEIIYQLMLDPQAGYRSYLTAIYQLFVNGETNLALTLRDDFWRWLSAPRNRRLVQKSALKLAEIVRDDGVWLVRYLLKRGQHRRAVAIGQLVRDHFAAELDEAVEAYDEYLDWSLSLLLGDALALWQDADQPEAEQLFARAIQVIERPLKQDYLKLHQDFFRGETYSYAGYLKRTLARYSEAVADYRNGVEAYQAYVRKPEQERSFEVREPYAQILLNLSYVEILQARFESAQRELNRFFNPEDNGTALYDQLLPDRQAIVKNVQSILFLERNNLPKALELVRVAWGLAQRSDRPRIIGIVAMNYADILHEQMKQTGTFTDEPRQFLQTALRSFPEEGTSRRELELIWAKYERNYGVSLREQGRIEEAQSHFAQALEHIEAALAATGTRKPDPVTGDEMSEYMPTVQGAELLQNKALVMRLKGDLPAATQLLERAEAMLRYDLPPYAHIIAGNIAIDRAQIDFRQGRVEEGTSRCVVALARAFIYSSEHRTVRSYRDRFSRIFTHLSEDELKRAIAALERLDPLKVASSAAELPYQRPAEDDWRRAYISSHSFIQKLWA